MKNVLLFIALAISFPSTAQFTYIFPMPGSIYHHPETNIILKSADTVDATSLISQAVSLSGTLSGVHSCNIMLADDQRTILVYPINLFKNGETVSVDVHDQFLKKNGDVIHGTSFQFKTQPSYTNGELINMKNELELEDIGDFGFSTQPSLTTLRTDSCAGLPAYQITTNDSDAFKGDVFYYNYQLSIQPNDNWYRTILAPDGSDTVFASCDDKTGVGWTINHDGHPTCYYIGDTTNCFKVFDSSFVLLQNYCAGNGLMADAHEFKVYPGGHGFITCDDPQMVDLTAYGSPFDSTVVIGAVIQELDANSNVIFEWRSWDHFQVDDAIAAVPLTTTTVDPVHMNSLERKDDTTLVVLCRHMNEITKINLNTGDIIWRWGGENNMFTFVNDDPSPWGEPHDLRVLPGGNYSIFNNNYLNNGARSNAKVYHLDETNLVATPVFKYEHPDVNGHSIHTTGLGSVQLLPNGNYFICWGLVLLDVEAFPNFTEVDTFGNIHWEMHFTGSEHYYCYRAFKFDWNPNMATSAANTVSTEKGDLLIYPNPINDAWSLKYTSDKNAAVTVRITDLVGSAIGEEVFNAKAGENIFHPHINFRSSDSYLVTLSSAKSFTTRKVIVIK